MPPRLRRFQHEGHLHFLTFSCYRRLPYLDNDPSRICCEELLEQCRQRHRFDIHGYVLMPNHVHLLVSEPEVRSLESTLRVLKGEVSKHLKGDRTQFWQRRYHDFNVFTEKKRIEKLKYLHRNPAWSPARKTGPGAASATTPQANLAEYRSPLPGLHPQQRAHTQRVRRFRVNESNQKGGKPGVCGDCT